VLCCKSEGRSEAGCAGCGSGDQPYPANMCPSTLQRRRGNRRTGDKKRLLCQHLYLCAGKASKLSTFSSHLPPMQVPRGRNQRRSASSITCNSIRQHTSYTKEGTRAAAHQDILFELCVDILFELCVCECVCARACVCVCVREREREKREI
jgi:hypothetical protein